MIDHLVGRPNPSWKRSQVFLVIFFWLWRITRGNAGPPRILWLNKANRFLKRYTPWQIIASTLTALYVTRNLDKILGLGSPEPLARLYSPSYYRVTWINTGLETGFATAMAIRPKWLRDICSILFSGYYILYASEADEKLRRFRAVPTVEMLRTTWEKTTNPYIRMFTHLPPVSVRRKVFLARPSSSRYKRPIAAYLFFHPHESQLRYATDLILDFPGGGFVAMSPEHHEERLRMWAITTGKPVLSIDYGKAPEYPYPFAIDEAFDTYKLLVESIGTVIGMSGEKLNVIISGDSAGATLAVNIIFKILELGQSPLQTSDTSSSLPQPVALVLNYAALDFNFTSWMSPANLRVLQSEQSSGNLPGLNEFAVQKDHLQHISPLSMVKDNEFNIPPGQRLKRRGSWKDAIRELTINSAKGKSASLSKSSVCIARSPARYDAYHYQHRQDATNSTGEVADVEGKDNCYGFHKWKEEDRPIQARVRYAYSSTRQPEPPITSQEANPQTNDIANEKQSSVGPEPIGTRLTMTSRTGFFQDRIVSPSMMRAMAILYIGPHRNPDFATDYHISPILAPSSLLAQFPPLLLQCGEKDPFVDDTVIFAGRVREAKQARRHELELIISGKSTRFDEGPLRLFTEGGSMDALKEERDRLASETESDWVQMVLFSDWSHGYLQMPTLMKEAKTVIEELAVWINETFSRNSQRTVAHASKGNGMCSDMGNSGINFVPKKYRNGPITISKPTGICDESETDLAASLLPVIDGPDSVVGDEFSISRSPDAMGKGRSGARQTQAGTQITEMELMRRRRLLDSHIFE